jgi:hypothetical protein
MDASWKDRCSPYHKTNRDASCKPQNSRKLENKITPSPENLRGKAARSRSAGLRERCHKISLLYPEISPFINVQDQVRL